MRVPLRLAVLGLSAVLVLGPGVAARTASAPASASTDPARAGETAPARVQFIADPRGDVRGVRRKEPERAVLDDLLSVRYATPHRVGGDLRITTRWAHLRDGSRRGAPGQLLWVEFRDSGGNGSWTVYAGNDDGRLVVEDYTGDEETSYIYPRRVEVDRRFGRNGRMDIVLSTEWMDRVRGVRFTAWGGGRGWGPSDPIAQSRYLAVGQPR